MIFIEGQQTERRHFFPWHRAQLIFFEAIVAELSGFSAFAMPYWDFTDCRTHKAPSFLFKTDSPFDVTRRKDAAELDIYLRRRQAAATGGDDTIEGGQMQQLANLNTGKWWHFMGFPPGILLDGFPPRFRNDDPDIGWLRAEYPEMEWGTTAPVDAGSHNFVHRQIGRSGDEIIERRDGIDDGA